MGDRPFCWWWREAGPWGSCRPRSAPGWMVAGGDAVAPAELEAAFKGRAILQIARAYVARDVAHLPATVRPMTKDRGPVRG